MELKRRLTTALDFTILNSTKPYVGYTNASGSGLGYVLMQWGKVVTYASR